MSNEVINVDGASGWVEVATGIVLTAETFIQASTSTIASLLAAVEEDYPEFEARVELTSGTPTENNTIDIHMRMGDGTNEAPAPSGDYAPHYRGSITLDNTASAFYFSESMALTEKNATIYLKSNEASTSLTVTLAIKAKTLGPAA